jgi:hypothetical protein
MILSLVAWGNFSAVASAMSVLSFPSRICKEAQHRVSRAAPGGVGNRMRGFLVVTLSDLLMILLWRSFTLCYLDWWTGTEISEDSCVSSFMLPLSMEVPDELTVHQHPPEVVKSSCLHFGVLKHVCVFVCVCVCVCVKPRVWVRESDTRLAIQLFCLFRTRNFITMFTKSPHCPVYNLKRHLHSLVL